MCKFVTRNCQHSIHTTAEDTMGDSGTVDERFTDRAKKAMTYAQEEARRFNHNYLGTEHQLLGLARDRDMVSAQILGNLGVRATVVRKAIEQIIGRGDQPYEGELGLTPRAKKVLELARGEAAQLGHNYVGTEHMLLGLVREGEG